MSFPIAPAHMYKLRNQTVFEFADDGHTGSRYTFNSLGYRSDCEFNLTDDAIIIFGNTLTFGLGLNVEQTFPWLISDELSCPVYNFSWGRYAHENSEQLALLKNILKIITPKLVIFQINNLNRHKINDTTVSFNNSNKLILQKFHIFNAGLQECLNTVPHILLHWDDEEHGVDFSNCLIYNKYHVDSIAFNNGLSDNPTMGRISHKLIALKILTQMGHNFKKIK
jgi:hypothetical protein